jgi:hypothetical protein
MIILIVGPVEIMFTLLEDRLIKQKSKAPENNSAQLKVYWNEQIKSWSAGLTEL